MAAGGLSAGPGRGECDGFAGDEGRELGRFGFLLCVGAGEPEAEREAVAELLGDAVGDWSVAGAEEWSGPVAAPGRGIVALRAEQRADGYGDAGQDGHGDREHGDPGR